MTGSLVSPANPILFPFRKRTKPFPLPVENVIKFFPERVWLSPDFMWNRRTVPSSTEMTTQVLLRATIFNVSEGLRERLEGGTIPLGGIVFGSWVRERSPKTSLLLGEDVGCSDDEPFSISPEGDGLFVGGEAGWDTALLTGGFEGGGFTIVISFEFLDLEETAYRMTTAIMTSNPITTRTKTTDL